MDDAAPLAADESAALFQPLRAFQHGVLAVSGGPDSMALMGLCAAWARQQGGPRLSVATVDHGFRPEAQEEVAFVIAQARAHGLEAYGLKREGPVPETGLQEAARAARYDLLYRCAAEIGADVVVTAHHADDQAETVVMRLCHGSGPGGLAGMRQDTPRGSVTLLRPFLRVPRARLAASLTAMGLDAIADPSNADERFERVRLRAIMAELAVFGLTRERLILLGERAARADSALDRAAEQAFARHRTRPEAGLGFGAALLGEPRDIIIRVLAKALARVVEGRVIRLERLEDLGEALVLARSRGEALGRTLGGTVIRLDRSGRISVVPEGPRHRPS